MSQFIDYNRVIDQAMRSIVKRCLRYVEKTGSKLPGNHHFYITFDVEHEGVDISENLRKLHKDQMTIVIQHQFWDLEVEEARFSVTLSFNNIKEKLVIPYDSLISFADPSARFGLQFHDDEDLVLPDDDEEIDDELIESLLDLGDEDDLYQEELDRQKEKKKSTKAKKSAKDSEKDSGEAEEDDESKVISIDSFRKK